MVCDDGFGDPTHHTSEVLGEYASDAYIAVCANIHLDKFETSFLSEADRVDLIQRTVTASTDIRALWTGEHLLFSGVSHGATAPVVAMARTDYDQGSGWKGTGQTAACFLDGVYDMAVTNDYLAGFPRQCGAVRQSLICDRYFDGDCAGYDPANMELTMDSISTSPADRFAIAQWKLIECGSAIPGCRADGDWIPAGPITQLCAGIDAGPGHICIDDPLPDEGHLICSTGTGSTKCRTWFNGLLPAEG